MSMVASILGRFKLAVVNLVGFKAIGMLRSAMEDVSSMLVTECSGSKYVQPLRLEYVQNGKPRIWDVVKAHDSVAVLLYNRTREVFLLVRQFRPAIYINKARWTPMGSLPQDSLLAASNGSSAENCQPVAPATLGEQHPAVKGRFDGPGSLGITYELCAGIIDKNKSNEVIMQEEILEECGYNVPLDNIKRITSARSGVGISGSLHILYYAEVTDDMKVAGRGGGNELEGELIDVYELPLSQARKFVMNEDVSKPISLMFAFMWFFDTHQQEDASRNTTECKSE